MMRGPLLSALCGVLLCACASTVEEQRRSLDEASVCCESISQLPFVPLTAGKPKSVKLDATSPAFDFDGAKSFFFAGSLPPYSAPLALSVESRGTVVPARPEMTSVFRPDVVFLDQSFRVTRRIQPASFKRSRGADLRATIFINPENATDAYVIVFTDPRTHAGDGGVVKAFTPHTFSLGGAPITLDGAEHSVPLSFSATGNLTLELQEYAPASISR
jgi:maltose operon protein